MLFAFRKRREKPSREAEHSWLSKTRRGEAQTLGVTKERRVSLGSHKGVGRAPLASVEIRKWFPIKLYGGNSGGRAYWEIPSKECHTPFAFLLILRTSFAFLYLFQGLLLSAPFYWMKVGMQWLHRKPASWALRTPRTGSTSAPSSLHKGTTWSKHCGLEQRWALFLFFFFFLSSEQGQEGRMEGGCK